MQARMTKGLVACLVACAALAGCADMGGGGAAAESSGTSGSGGSGSSGGAATKPDKADKSDQSDKSASGYHEGARAGDGGGMAAVGSPMQGWRGVVQAIEPMSRQEAGIGVGGSPAAAAVGGALPGTGSGMERVYRVTLRTDDGSSRSVVVEAAPDYKVGDRVGYSDGMIQRQ